MSLEQKRATLFRGDVARVARARGSADPPSLAVWEITGRCDLACGHCGSRSGTARRNELSTAEALSLVDELADFGIREVSLIGGEAYLRSDWADIAAAIVRRGMSCGMVTGAFGFDRSKIDQAAAAGVSIVTVSLDGLAAAHDRVRGRPGSWERAIDNARHIVAAGITLGINSQVNKLTLPDLPRLARSIVEVGGTSWMVILTAAMGRAADRPDMLLQPYELHYLFPLLDSIRRDILDPAKVTVHAASNLGYCTDLSESFRYGAAAGHHWTGCNAGTGVVGIESNGDIKGCPSLPSGPFVAGNTRGARLAEIGATARFSEGSRRTREDLWGFCATCDYADLCKAGCTWTSHVLFGRAGNNPYCHHRVSTLREQGRRETLRRVAAAPRERFDHGLFEIVEEPFDVEAADTVGGLQNFLSLATTSLEPEAQMISDERLRALARRTP